MHTTREMKKDKHRTRIIVGGNKIKYNRDVGTPTAHIENSKLLFNSVLSNRKAILITIDIPNLYIMTTMDEY